MSAQLYLANLISEGRAYRAPHEAALRHEGLAVRPERRKRRARKERKH